jgi:hypothetical protein
MGKSKKSSKKPAETKAPAPKATGPKHSEKEIIAALSGDYVTAVQLGVALNVTKTTAQIYLKRLGKSRKLETKAVRQGLRGPKAIGFKVRGR